MSMQQTFAQQYSLQQDIPATAQGMRVDALLGLFLPLGVRARRRLWETHVILLDNKAVAPGQWVQGEATVQVIPLQTEKKQATHSFLYPYAQPFIQHEDAELLLLVKPSGLHSAHIAGSGEPNMESHFAQYFQDVNNGKAQWVLVNRLDKETSGFLIALNIQTFHTYTQHSAQATSVLGHAYIQWRAKQTDSSELCSLEFCSFNQCLQQFFRDLEDKRLVTKEYYALVLNDTGKEPQEQTISMGLNVSNRKKTTVLSEVASGAVRGTVCVPLQKVAVTQALQWLHTAQLESAGAYSEQQVFQEHEQKNEYEVWLVRCMIQKGVRHQIRAHLAHAGMPLWGDALYGDASDAMQEFMQLVQLLVNNTQSLQNVPQQYIQPWFFLHHYQCTIGEQVFVCNPTWMQNGHLFE